VVLSGFDFIGGGREEQNSWVRNFRLLFLSQGDNAMKWLVYFVLLTHLANIWRREVRREKKCVRYGLHTEDRIFKKRIATCPPIRQPYPLKAEGAQLVYRQSPQSRM
jgi:hypothetical protein